MEPFILAHEFLFLLCNCEDRLKTIKRVHRPDLVSNKGFINHWELLDKHTGKHQVSHFDVLSKGAFENKAPHVVIQEVLNKEAEEKHIRIVGLHPTTKEPKSATLMQASQGEEVAQIKAGRKSNANDEVAAFIGVPSKSENSVTNTER